MSSRAQMTATRLDAQGADAEEHTVIVEALGVRLAGELVIPKGAEGIVLFAHGSGSSRHSPRNRYVASTLHGSGLGTLLIDLLTPEEERVDNVTREHRFDIEMLTNRLSGAVDWLARHSATAELLVGTFGASTGAAAALGAAAERPQRVAAVVSRGGRPDLAGTVLTRVTAPTLCIVGERDEQVLELNRAALTILASPEKKLVIVPGATHLFEEPGTLDEAARLAREWFARHLGAASTARQ